MKNEIVLRGTLFLFIKCRVLLFDHTPTNCKAFFRDLALSHKAISTQKVAKSGCYFMMELMKVLIYSPKNLMVTLKRIIKFLAGNATRDSTRQDRINGRCQLGLEPILE